MPNGKLYITAIYFTVTTCVTVGYGDITAANTTERFICIVIMIGGVLAFSFITGAFANIIA